MLSPVPELATFFRSVACFRVGFLLLAAFFTRCFTFFAAIAAAPCGRFPPHCSVRPCGRQSTHFIFSAPCLSSQAPSTPLPLSHNLAAAPGQPERPAELFDGLRLALPLGLGTEPEGAPPSMAAA